MSDIISLTDAQNELAIINSAISEYYSGTRRTILRVKTGTLDRSYTFSDSSELFNYMVQRRDELQRYIFSKTQTDTTPTFTVNRNIPLIFKR